MWRSLHTFDDACPHRFDLPEGLIGAPPVVDDVIGKTFVISGVLAGSAGVMWGIHNGLFNHYVGFLPGIKAFTAAVLGGIGNIPGAMMGGMLLGLLESVGPAALGLDFQLKDVIAFTILILVLIFRPSGLLGEALSEEKV